MRIHKHKFIRSLLFILFVVYFSQGLVYASGTLISQVSLFLIIVISGNYFVKTLFLKNYNNRFYAAWTAFFLLNIFGFLFSESYDFYHVSLFKNTLVALITFYPFYFYANHDLLEAKHLLWFFALMFLITIFQFYTTRAYLQLVENKENVVNNIAYMFVIFIPFVFLLKKYRLISSALLAVILMYIILANKRGAIIAAAIGVVVFAYYQFRTIERKNRLRSYCIAFGIVMALGYFVYHNYTSNEYFMYRMASIAEGHSSQRDVIYSRILYSWWNADSLKNFLFGFGLAGSVKLTGYYAHNDWLELISNFGLLGVSVYLFLFYAVYKALKNNNWGSDKRILMFAITGIWFSTTIYSMWYSSIAVSTQAMLLAYLIGSKRSSLI